MRVVVNSDGATLYPIDYNEKKRIIEQLGIESERESLPRIFATPACNFLQNYEGKFWLRLGKRIISAIPEPEDIPGLRKKKVWNTSPVPAPELTFLKNDKGIWSAKHPAGVVVVPAKDWLIEADQENDNRSRVYRAGELSIRPAITANILIAGSPVLLANMDEMALAIFEEVSEERKFENAQEFNILGRKRTPFEVLGTSFLRGDVISITDFTLECEDLIKRAREWMKVTLLRVAHPDHAHTILAEIFEINKLDIDVIDTFMKQNVGLQTSEVTEMLDNSIREFEAAVDWFKDWMEFAKEEVKTRHRLGAKMTVPQPYGRKMRHEALIDCNTEAIAVKVREAVERQAAMKRPENKMLNPITSNVMTILTTDDLAAVMRRRGYTKRQEEPPQNEVIANTKVEDTSAAIAQESQPVGKPEGIATIGEILGNLNVSNKSEPIEINAFCPKCNSTMEKIPIDVVQLGEACCDCGWIVPKNTEEWEVDQSDFTLTIKQYKHISQMLHDTPDATIKLWELAGTDVSVIAKPNVITKQRARVIINNARKDLAAKYGFTLELIPA